METLNGALANVGVFTNQGSGDGNADCFFEMLCQSHFTLFEKGLHMRWIFSSIFFALGRLQKTHPFFWEFNAPDTDWSMLISQAAGLLDLEPTFKVTPTLFTAYGRLLHRPDMHCGDVEQSILFKLCDIDLVTFCATTTSSRQDGGRQWKLNASIQNCKTPVTEHLKRSALTVGFDRTCPLLMRGYVDGDHYVSFGFDDKFLRTAHAYIDNHNNNGGNSLPMFVPRKGDVTFCASGDFCGKGSIHEQVGETLECSSGTMVAHEDCSCSRRTVDYQLGVLCR